MAYQFERMLWEDPEFLDQTWFSDETYVEYKLANSGREGSFAPPCRCVKDPTFDQIICKCENSQVDFQIDALKSQYWICI